jgi:hypothetical protein
VVAAARGAKVVSACGRLVGCDRATATILTLRSSNMLQQRDDGLHAASEVIVLGLDLVALAEGSLQLLQELFAFEPLDATLQRHDLVAGAFADCSLSLAVVCSLLSQLLRGQVGDTTRRGATDFAFSATHGSGIYSWRPCSVGGRV